MYTKTAATSVCTTDDGLTSKPARTYQPGDAVSAYGELYEDYLVLHDHFGRKRDLLRRLRAMRR